MAVTNNSKVALITGSTRGLGAETARRLALDGYHVVITGRDAGRGELVLKEIVGAGGSAAFVRADVSIEAEVKHLVAETIGRFGTLHVLVNNAAPCDLMADATTHKPHESDSEQFDAIVKTTLYGTFWGCKYALPHLVKSGGSAIVNISTGGAMTGFVGVPAAYVSAKAGVQALTRQIAVDYGPDMVRANTIVIGILKNELTAPMWESQAMASAMLRMQMIPHPGTNVDVAQCISFLASDAAQFITGQDIRLDGGMTLKCPLGQEMIHAAAGGDENQ